MKKCVTVANSFLKRLSFQNIKLRNDEIKALLSKNDKLDKYCSSNARRTPLKVSGEERTYPTRPRGQRRCLQHSSHLALNSVSSCAKYLIIVSNTTSSVTGLLILTIGIWGLSEKKSFHSEQISHLGSDPMLFLALVGFAACSVSLLGCIGALFENIFLLKFFIGVIQTVVILEVLSGIVIFFLRHHIMVSLQNSLTVAVLHYKDDPDLQFIMDEIQKGLQCCGVVSYLDWKINLYFNCSSPGVQACGVPASCCLDPLQNGTILNSQCGFGTLGLEEFVAQSIIYLGGCVPQLSKWLYTHAGAIGFCVVVLIVIEVGSLFLATKLLSGIAFASTQHYSGRECTY